MKSLRWIVVILGVFGLISVRMLEDKIFYDPFLAFFKHDFQNAPFPEFVWSKLIISHLFRFLLNLIFSAIIIQFSFMNFRWTLQGVLLIVLTFLIAFPVYLYCIYNQFDIGYLFSFYMRRFVIQPIILLLIIPMFYYRWKMPKNI